MVGLALFGITEVIGGSTRAGSERYAKSGSGGAFTIAGDVVSGLQYAEMGLPERRLPNHRDRLRLGAAR